MIGESLRCVSSLEQGSVCVLGEWLFWGVVFAFDGWMLMFVSLVVRFIAGFLSTYFLYCFVRISVS